MQGRRQPGPSDRNWRRVVVTGNSGAGKSVLAGRIGATLNLPTHDLDVLLRRPDGRNRAAADARARVADVAAGDDWVIEGVFPDLIEVALARAAVLVWLDLSWDECREGLLARGPHYGMDPQDDGALLAWANAHRARLIEHVRLYDGFAGRKVHLRTRRDVESFTPLPR